MTPETDILTLAVLLSRERCSLNFHFWPPGPWDPCYFHLRDSWFSLFPLPLSSLQRHREKEREGASKRERAHKQERNTQDCSYSINRSDCTSSLVTFRLLTDAQLPAPLSYRKFHDVSWFTTTTKVYCNLQPADAKRRFSAKTNIPHKKTHTPPFFKENVTCNASAYWILILPVLQYVSPMKSWRRKAKFTMMTEVKKAGFCSKSTGTLHYFSFKNIQSPKLPLTIHG